MNSQALQPPASPQPRGLPPTVTEAAPARKLMLLADYVHPFVYREGFPQGAPDVDLALVAGDVPGYYLEFLATTLTVPVLYVHGNHANELVNEGEGVVHPPRGVTNIHGRVVEVGGLRLAGWGGVPRYREGGSGQYGDLEASWGLTKLGWKLRGKPLDILLTHAPPEGPHAGSDHAHRGCAALTRFARKSHPRLLVHGHIHEYEGKKLEYQEQATRVVNAYGYRIIEL